MFSPAALKVKLKEEAEALGFDGFGICSADDFSPEEAASMRRWLDAGMFDQMAYLERAYDKKISPRKYLPSAQSAICVAANFFRNSPERRIALYAQSEDYHDVIKPKLEKLSEILTESGGEQRISVDASPLWEKLLARRAGIGWTGKNTLVIRELNGPWSFLGIILTSLDLPDDVPTPNLCSDCRKCVDACPVGALTSDGLDARKCISNLTIERKKDLSQEEKMSIGGKIFGCDICLRACPYSPKIKTAIMPEFDSVKVLSSHPDETEILRVSKGTPMQRKFSRPY